ncbi:MAG: hypothetical protein A3H32_15130 [Betaproteobacteria bacterium RIFCSPLOWO2_02_FULL_63_19]|nr:MAG: hypothetical protein A3H32_15130 [Betaproteobacteria bacterium RIFCSPLOWO2_02_FULL_63_19]
MDRDAAEYPEILRSRLGADAPAALVLLGNENLLKSRKTALFCSASTPGDAILRAHDAARRMRDEGETVISGFHSPIEEECLRILLRGKQPLVVCPARAIEALRVPPQLRDALGAGRILYLSPFVERPTRITRESSIRRNEVVAALADDAYIAHVSPGGMTAKLAQSLASWGIPTAFSS